MFHFSIKIFPYLWFLVAYFDLISWQVSNYVKTIWSDLIGCPLKYKVWVARDVKTFWAQFFAMYTLKHLLCYHFRWSVRTTVWSSIYNNNSNIVVLILAPRNKCVAPVVHLPIWHQSNIVETGYCVPSTVHKNDHCPICNRTEWK